MEQTHELDIKHYLRLVMKRRYFFVIAAVFIITAVVAAAYLIPPMYEAKTVVSIEKSFLDNIIKNIGGARVIEDKATALSTVMKSRTLVFKVISDLGVDVQRKSEAAVEDLIKRTQDRTQILLEFSKAARSDVDFFTVSFRDRDPRYARDYVNNVVSKYIEESVGSKREESFGANRFLLDQINQFKEKVEKIDAEIFSLKKEEDIILYNKYLELQNRRDALLVQYTEDHPEVIKVKSEIEALKTKYNFSQKKLSHAANVNNRLGILERERESTKKIYDELTSAYGKTEVSTQAEIQNKAGTFKIVDPAVLPIKPVSPNRILIILLGIVGGIAGAAGLIVLLDTFDDSIKNVDTIKSLGVPVLAIIPHIQNPDTVINSRRKDIALYIFSGLFVALLCAVVVREVLVMLG